MAAIVQETVDRLAVRPGGGDDHWVGEAPDWFGEVLFGGFVLGQAVHAATRAAPGGARIHSLHGYFLRPVLAGHQLDHRVEVVRDGRSFASRRLEVSQQGAPVFTGLCSFTTDGDGYEYELPLARDVPGPDQLGPQAGPGPWLRADAGPTPAGADGVRTSTHRAWLRLGASLPSLDEDPHLHAALLAFASDMTGTGGRPRRLEGGIEGMISLDHAVWFHRPARADQWLFFDVHSLVNTGGRGTLRATLHDEDRRVVLSMAQEMLLRVVPPDTVGP
jgi:acyl-CoA thioesterase II